MAGDFLTQEEVEALLQGVVGYRSLCSEIPDGFSFGAQVPFKNPRVVILVTRESDCVIFSLPRASEIHWGAAVSAVFPGCSLKTSSRGLYDSFSSRFNSLRGWDTTSDCSVSLEDSEQIIVLEAVHRYRDMDPDVVDVFKLISEWAESVFKAIPVFFSTPLEEVEGGSWVKSSKALAESDALSSICEDGKAPVSRRI